MQFLIGLALFPFIVWATVTLCTKRGWPLLWGLIIGIVLQPLGHIVGFLVAVLITRYVGPAPGAIFFVFGMPLFAGLLPLAVAALMSQNPGAEFLQEQDNVASAACPACGRMNAVTTRVCPRCGNRSATT